MKLFTLSLSIVSSGFAQEPPKGPYNKVTLNYLNGKKAEGYIKCSFSYTDDKLKFIPLKGEDADKVISDGLESMALQVKGASCRFDLISLTYILQETSLRRKSIGFTGRKKILVRYCLSLYYDQIL